MNATSSAEQCLHNGDPVAALTSLQEQVRLQPGDAKLRTFLFQLLSVLGQWERAYTQLEMAAKLDPAALAMAQMYREALRCEVIREKVFSGEITPTVFGKPEQWLALLIEASSLMGRGQIKQAESLRSEAYDSAPTTGGRLNGQPFEWIADADMRLGPVLEAIINGTYYWIPFNRLTRISCEAPEDLRDLVWMPAHLELVNEGETVALIPSRYPGTERSDDGSLLLSRKTTWNEVAPELFLGVGQRVLATDAGDVPLMEVHEIQLTSGDDAAGGD
ncbi:MAG: type VI secretion system accessory protein TagJ [Pseudolabrys sp.]